MIEYSEFLQGVSETINSLFNVAVTIIDTDFTRVAGTHHYKKDINKRTDSINVYKHVMNNDKTILILNPVDDPICHVCDRRMSCTEKAAIYAPLKAGASIIGSIALVALTEEQKNNSVFNSSNFKQFVHNLNEFIAGKLEARKYSDELEHSLRETLAILNSVHDGVIAINREGTIYQINKSASSDFQISEKLYMGKHISSILPAKLSDKIISKCSLVDYETSLKTENSKRPVLLTSQTIDEDRGTVITFKSMTEAGIIVRKLNAEAYHTVTFDDIIGNNEAINKIKEMSKRIAISDSTILIRGESGTGKEMFARAIHSESLRASGPFVAVNCAAIPEPLLESELFGYEEGAFTGARRNGKLGKCELAIGGTLFLDEVGDIPLFLQSKFLRMIQERVIERIGGTKPIPIDIRIIAATNKNLEEMIANKEYREDLYYRLNVIPINLPPLRSRIDDISILSTHFLKKYSDRLDKNITGFSKEATIALLSYDWPGNLRELENAIEYAVNIEPSTTVDVASLPSRVVGANAEMALPQPPAAGKAAASDANSQSEATPHLRTKMQSLSVEEVIKALDKYGWSTMGKKNAAKSLNIGIATLYRILNKQYQ